MPSPRNLKSQMLSWPRDANRDLPYKYFQISKLQNEKHFCFQDFCVRDIQPVSPNSLVSSDFFRLEDKGKSQLYEFPDLQLEP